MKYFYLVFFLLLTNQLIGQVSGYVFRDLDADGFKDVTATFNEVNVSGITVTAYEADGTTSTLTTDASGAYSFTGLAMPVRIEFSNYLIGDYSSFVGSNNSTSVQFYDGATTNANFGINYPDDYCHTTNPDLFVPIFRNGDALDGSQLNKSALVDFSYDVNGIPIVYGGAEENPAMLDDFISIGAVWGTAYQQNRKRIFLSSFTKRHSGFGPRGIGGIYVVDISSGSPVLSSFDLQNYVTANASTIDLGSVNRTSSDPLYDLGAIGFANVDLDAFAKVGTTSFGDTEISDDDKTLWVTNLNQTALISIDVSGATLPGAVNQYVLTGLPTCTAGSFRIFGLKFYRGSLYVGGVCTGGAPDGVDQDAYVLKYDPNNIAAGYTIALQFPLDYSREGVGGNGLSKWQPWSFTWNTAFQNQNWRNPEPILSNIDFTIDEAMVVSLMDRHGHQVGFKNYFAITTPQSIADEQGLAMGDLHKACYNPASGTWTIEGGTCLESDPASLSGQSSTDGPSGTGEFYYGDYFSDNGTSLAHEEVTIGSTAILKGTDDVISTAFDPIGPSGYQTQGIQRYSSITGGKIDAYRILSNQEVQTFGKASGLGDIELVCNQPPLEIGNRLWVDTDGDGVQDPGELPIAGVTIEIYAANGTTLLGTSTTSANGTWYFNNTNVILGGATGLLPNTNYIIKVGTSDWSAGAGVAQLAGYILTSANVGGTGQPDVRDNDALLVSGSPTISYTTGYYGENDHTLDMGFRLPCTPPTQPVIGVTNTACPTGTGSFDILTPCAAGSTIEWSVDGGTTWSSTAPTYAAGVTALARCKSDTDVTCVSVNSNSVTTAPTTPPNCDDNDVCTTDTYDTGTCTCSNVAIPNCGVTPCSISITAAGPTTAGCDPATGKYVMQVTISYTGLASGDAVLINGQSVVVDGSGAQTFTLPVTFDADGLAEPVTVVSATDPTCLDADGFSFTAPAPCNAPTNPCESPSCDPVPTYNVCDNASNSQTLMADPLLANVLWFNSAGTQVGTGNSFVVDSNTAGMEDGSECFYSTASDLGICGALSCCPVIIQSQACCPVPNCWNIIVVPND